MAILYDWYENPGESDDSEEKGLHPRIFYITYGKRTAPVNHPAQFIRSHLTKIGRAHV